LEGGRADTLGLVAGPDVAGRLGFRIRFLRHAALGELQCSHGEGDCSGHDGDAGRDPLWQVLFGGFDPLARLLGRFAAF